MSLTSTVPAATATASPIADPGGVLRIVQSLPVPNPSRPGPLAMAVFLEGGAEWIEAGFCSSALTLLSRERVPGPFQQGWNRVAFGGDALAPGLVFYTLQCGRGAKSSGLSGGRAYRLP